jgi:3'-5' exoribonuclease
MSRIYVTQLGERENIDQIFLAQEKQLRSNRNGNLYLQVRLSDKSGSLTAMMWNASDRIYGSFEDGSYVRVQGTTQYYNSNLQMIINRIDRAEPGNVDEREFVTVSNEQVDALASRLSELLRSIENEHLRNLVECFLMDEQFMAKLTAAPAGVKNHHAYRGGLLEHIVSLMEVVNVVSPRYEELDRDLMLAGAFLHDMGKIDELTYERGLGYSNEGQLIGHIVMAVSMLENKIAEAEKLSGESFPAELQLRLKHMIVSHHGEYAYGSPKLPMTYEAVALHYLDNLDAKLHAFSQLMKEDANAASSWTPYQAGLGRKLFKGET